MGEPAVGTQPTSFCTITTDIRLGYCAVLVESLQRHHPGCAITVLRLGPSGVASAAASWAEELTQITLDDLNIPAPALDSLRTSTLTNEQYQTALEPWLLSWALEHGQGPALFIADDFHVLRSLRPVTSELSPTSAALVRRSPPLVPTSAANLSRLPEEHAIDSHLVGVGAKAEEFLAAWQRAALRAATDPSARLELFLDSAADAFPIVMVDDRLYNHGWWTVTESGPSGPAGGDAQGPPPVALHLHGFDHRRPHQVASSLDGRLPLRLSEHPWLATACAEYAAAVSARAPGELGCPATASPGDVPAAEDPFALGCWRRARDAAAVGRAPQPPDLRSLTKAELASWLSSPPEGSASPVGRYLLEVYRSRADLQLAFPDLVGQPEPFLRWARIHGRAELGLLSDQARARSRPGRSRTGSGGGGDQQPGVGVNMVGLLGSHLGLGEAARQTMAALRVSGVATRGYSFTQTDAPALRQAFSNQPQRWFGINLLHMNPPELLHFQATAGAPLMRRRYNVGLWVWETEAIPSSWRRAFRLVDEIWVPSDWVGKTFARETSVPVLTFPHPVPRPEHPRYMDRRHLGLPEGYLFLFMCDLASSINRKNLLGLVQAFGTAFRPGEGPRLIIKTMNGEANLADFEQLLLAVRERRDITVYDRVLSTYERAALLDACDCYVSLHRAEGFGLTMAEAMALAKPVVATAYSGNLAYMTDRNSYLVGYQLNAVGVEWDRYPDHHFWADPDLHEAARTLRHVWEHQEEARERGRLAALDVASNCAPEVVGPLMRTRIEQIWAARTDWGALKRVEYPLSVGRVLHHIGASVRRWSP